MISGLESGLVSLPTAQNTIERAILDREDPVKASRDLGRGSHAPYPFSSAATYICMAHGDSERSRKQRQVPNNETNALLSRYLKDE